MTITMRALGLSISLVTLGACGGSDGPSDPCSDAKSGEACRWAGTGDIGLNREHPNLHRLDSFLNAPWDLTFGPDGRAYIADFNNHMIRRVEADQTLHTMVGTDFEGDGSPEMEDRLPVCNPAGALGTVVSMNHPTEVRFGPDGLLYISAWHNNKIRTLDTQTGIVKTVAGNYYGYAGDNGPACAAVFNQPKSVVFAPDGSLYTVDQRNIRIRHLGPLPDRIVTTIAGTGKLGNAGDGGPALQAEFGFEPVATPRPSGSLALVGNNLYIADSMNNRIRRIDLTTGIIDCIAGASAEAGYSGDGGPALQAKFNFPQDLEIGPDGRLYVAERYNHVIRAIDLTTGIVQTVVGNGQKCENGTDLACPDRAPQGEMQLNEPGGLAFDAEGNMYVADSFNNRILKVMR